MTLTQKKQVKSRIIAGKVLDILESHDLLGQTKHLGMKNWNGKKVMVSEIVALTIEEQENLEKEIVDQVNQIL